MNMCSLIPIIVGAICALLGYLLGKMLGKGPDNTAEIQALKNKIAELEGNLKSCKDKLGAIQMQDSRMAAAMAHAAMPFNAAEAKAIFGKVVKENDLTIVEGIGPKIQELFHKHGVHTWKALSECSVPKCQEVLDDGGEAYKIHNPKTWPKQALLAYEGKWKELFDWQQELDGGL
ncbi:hypothetical protein [Mangrovimonas sp. DI 80]|uniref:hypothetical protein n=2 Tax=Mangrovimonas TaxID=1211036 RepID=UPI0006B48D91|nr:hypothetical protein [Mangrovimonas sp. DI 80]OMP32074.1 LSU ribosomal protein L21p [Mangrovimonas sp. DI 80]